MRYSANLKARWLVVLGLLAVSSCGARLPKAVSRHTPVSLEQAINLDEIEVTRLQDGSTVNMGRYMRERNLQWMVLTFGSEGCNICMDKAEYLQKNLVDNSYELLGANAKGSIELIGVTTDPASRRESVYANLVEEKKLSHFEWSDPARPDGNIMMRYFQPAGHGPGVPLTVMLSSKGIMWRVGSWDHLTAAQIIEKIAGTLGANAVPPPPVPEHGGNGGNGGTTTIRPLLAMERPDRLNDVALTVCGDRSQTKLGTLLPASANGLRAVLVHKEACAGNPACEDARKTLETWSGACKNTWQKDCAFKELVVSDQFCGGDQSLLAGGGEFFDVFADHFTWSYKPIPEAAGKLRLAEMKGPMTLIFNADGKLVFSREGAIGDSLTKRMNKDKLAAGAEGPEYPLFWNDTPKSNHAPSGVKATFAGIRARTKYTAVMFWNTMCRSCTEEIDEWHKEADSAFNFCTAHPEFCQVVALETDRAESGKPAGDYLAGLLDGNNDFDGWRPKHWDMPLAVEDVPLADGRAPMGWFAGWIRSRMGSIEPRVVIFDSEGKVVQHWRSLPGEHGPRDLLKTMFDRGE